MRRLHDLKRAVAGAGRARSWTPGAGSAPRTALRWLRHGWLPLWLSLCASACPPAPTPAGQTSESRIVVQSCRMGRDSDCDDGVFCNGQERCVSRPDQHAEPICASAAHPACPGRACDEASKSCDCNDPDRDHDGYASTGCAVPDEADCDDDDSSVHPGAAELCDPDGRDEDCDPRTFGSKDQDGDHAIDQACWNEDAEHELRYAGTDCRDDSAQFSPSATETCDGADNDCDGAIDEDHERNPGVDGGLQDLYYRDRDGDGFGTDDVTQRGCTRPEGYVAIAGDCDDDPRHPQAASIHPDAPELCNGFDDDCDGRIDDDDTMIFERPDFPDTELVCAGKDGWVITRCPAALLDCDPGREGCETDANSLSSCHACDRRCEFSCGARGCNEIDQLAAGTHHVCASAQGHLSCWGRNGDGRLGNDSLHPAAVAQPVALQGVGRVAAGREHTCATSGPERTLYCWGSDLSGQLGATGTDASSTIPLPVSGIDGGHLSSVVSVAAGREHSCAVLADGRVACWGQGALGRLADHDLEAHVAIAPALAQRGDEFASIEDAREVVAGETHTCIVTVAGDVDCWGDNGSHQLGDGGVLASSHNALRVPGVARVERIAAGPYHTCALAAGLVSCWGDNGAGQLGPRPDGDMGEPAVVPGVRDAVALAAGAHFTCAASQAQLWCWGSNNYGERGDASPDPSPTPHAIDLQNVRALAAGSGDVCALVDERALCWGSNNHGQLGGGSADVERHPTPTRIQPLAGSIP